VRFFKSKFDQGSVQDKPKDPDAYGDYKTILKDISYPSGRPKPLPTTLFAYPTCPHCNKVISVLDLLGHEYALVTVNPITKAEIKWSEKYRKVPIVRMADQEIFGSDKIIMELEDLWRPYNKIASGMDESEYEKWNRFVDEDLARPLFRATSENWSDAFQYTTYVRDMDAYPMYMRIIHHYIATFFTKFGSGRAAKKYKITDAEGDVEKALIRFLETFENEDGKFHGGDLPSYADLLVFGTLRCVQDFPAVCRLLEKNAQVASWYATVAEAVGETACVSK